MPDPCNLPEDLPLGALISVIFRTRIIILNQHLRQFGLSYGQYPIIVYLLDHENTTQEMLVKKFHIDRGTIARMVKKLEDSGYVIRRTDPVNRRAVRLFPAAKAKEIARELIGVDQEWEKIVTSSLTEPEQEHLKRVMYTMSSAVLHHLHETGCNECRELSSEE
ncbi:MAG: MarR family transcriptional regulator [Methanospirillum sp.]|nr:MarR family transcriptional regulator [Methanospirillum sp.]